MTMTAEYTKFYLGKDLTRRELKKLDLIDRVRYTIKRNWKEEGWSAREVHKKLLDEGLITEYVTIFDVEAEMRAFYG